MSKSDYILVSKHDLECMAMLIVKLLDSSFSWHELEKLEDSIDYDVFEIIANVFREYGAKW